MQWELICPTDGHALEAVESGQAYACNGCQRRYAVERGIIRFVGESDDFYEGAYANRVSYTPRSEKWYHVFPLWMINSGYVWKTRRHVSPGSTVVELGCASGVRYFGQRYHMIGVDLSFSSLAGMVGTYDLCMQADAAQGIPLPDESVDAVLSSYFWEHIPPAVKPRILRECSRILKPDGKLVFLYDVESENPLVRWMRKRNEAMYQRLFLEHDGHFGYQTPAANRKLFADAGFRVIEHLGMERTWIQSSSVYEKMRHWGSLRGRLARFGRSLGGRPWFLPYTFLVRAVDGTIGRIFPERWSRIAMSICEKRR